MPPNLQQRPSWLAEVPQIDSTSEFAKEATKAGWAPYGEKGEPRSLMHPNPMDAYRPYRRTEFTLEGESPVEGSC